MTYVKALAILLLLSGLIFGLWKLYDAGGDAREDRLVREFQQKEIERQGEILKLQHQITEQKQAAEKYIQAERHIWQERINEISRIPTDCAHSDILRLLRESGVYTGRIPCQQLQPSDNG